jgi:hypothetical protein
MIYSAGVVVENLNVVGLGPGTDAIILKIFLPKQWSKK